MRKVIVLLNTTLDGFASGPNGEMDWHFQCWNEEMEKNMHEFFYSIDMGMMGRNTYEAMAAYWPAAALDPTLGKRGTAFANHMNNLEKLVFSRTLQQTNWSNCRLASNDIKTEIVRIKGEKGKDLGLMGSGLIQSFLDLGLVDEFRLLVHPVFLGKGKPLFNHQNGWRRLDLLDSKTFSNGVVVLRLAA